MKLRAGVVAALLAASLVGCGDDEPTPPPDSSTMSGLATPTTPTESPTDEPSATFDPKKETARQFIRRWIRLGNQMQATGETESYLAITSEACRSCKQFADAMAEIYENDGWVKSKGDRPISIRHDGKAQWTVEVDVAPSEFIESAGGEVQTLPGGRVTFVVYILRDDGGHWVMTDYSEVA